MLTLGRMITLGKSKQRVGVTNNLSFLVSIGALEPSLRTMISILRLVTCNQNIVDIITQT